jgi:hypothetical protein
MIVFIGALILGVALLVWLWKVPVKKMVTAMKKSGSSSFEAYFMVFLLTGGLAFAVYMIAEVV